MRSDLATDLARHVYSTGNGKPDIVVEIPARSQRLLEEGDKTLRKIGKQKKRGWPKGKKRGKQKRKLTKTRRAKISETVKATAHRRRSKKHTEKIPCLQCGKLFWPKRHDQKFHTRTCAKKYQNAHKVKKHEDSAENG